MLFHPLPLPRKNYAPKILQPLDTTVMHPSLQQQVTSRFNHMQASSFTHTLGFLCEALHCSKRWKGEMQLIAAHASPSLVPLLSGQFLSLLSEDWCSICAVQKPRHTACQAWFVLGGAEVASTAKTGISWQSWWQPDDSFGESKLQHSCLVVFP